LVNLGITKDGIAICFDKTIIFDNLGRMFPTVLSGKEEYINLSAGEHFDKLIMTDLFVNFA